jgi:hypothetical protein
MRLRQPGHTADAVQAFDASEALGRKFHFTHVDMLRVCLWLSEMSRDDPVAV